jgi:hypothetical protein
LLTSFALGPCLLRTKVFDTALHMSEFFLSLFSYWSPTRKRPQILKAILSKKSNAEGVTVPRFKLCCRATLIK